MKIKSLVVVSFMLGILLTVLTPILILATGAIDVGADVKPGLVERTVASWGRGRSVAKRAPNEKNPFTGDSDAVRAGLDHYRENCVMCHGAPEVPGGELSKGINPPPPSLGKKEGHISDGKLFWVVKHGIRMTAMPAFGPTHTDEEIWKIVAFIRHLPDMTVHERDSLRAATDENAHHHEEPNAPLAK